MLTLVHGRHLEIPEPCVHARMYMNIHVGRQAECVIACVFTKLRFY